ncbi:MAG: heme ABC exporter ATP-binding protein CcmA [Proteobacteria bacterium]|nr:heme ABC exporter ATP-binding protein CcmA [Pseudomonadota bacterium]
MATIDFAEVPPLLAARGLAYARNEEAIFGPLDFSLAAGEVVLIEGDNGSGKTTLLKVLSGLIEPTAGEVLLHGVPLTLAKLSHQVALLGHLPGMKLELTVFQNLSFAIGLGGIRAGITPHSALASVGLAGYEDQPLRLLSAGQKKRAALARLLLVPAALWLLDEPYANLDREGIELVNRLLALHASRGGAALITSHGAYAYTSGTPRRIALAGSSPSKRQENFVGQSVANRDAGLTQRVAPPRLTDERLPPNAGSLGA